ncbi:MAG TPA: hypothetical protein VNA88_01210, partial [Candidatus Kapabacteria bacterium]|nr:hypothetical protein [Candidatus Kapabacteria bacterium]
MFKRYLPYLLLLLAGHLSVAHAQSYAPVSNVPWNGYLAVRLPDGFSSIIGEPGTVLIPGTSTDDDGIFTMPLNMPFFFIDRVYNATGATNGYNLRVSMNGYIGFNGSANTVHNISPYLNYTTSTTYPYYNRVIMAYWNDRIGAGVTNGGIYYQYAGNVGDRVLTVEWRTQQYDSPPEGNIQVKMYERTGNIEWHYGSSDAGLGTQGSVLTYGVTIGIKNFGQSTGIPSGDDAEKFLLFNNPEVANVPIAYTRLWVEGSQPEYLRYLLTVDGAYFHTDFPRKDGARVSFRASRVQNDVSSDSVWFTPTAAGNAYGPGSSVTVNARFSNLGNALRSNVPVQADIYLNNGATPVASLMGTAFTSGPTPALGRSIVTFATPFAAPLSNIVGEYRVHVYPKLTGDEDVTDDTTKGTFYIVKNNDVTPYRITEPHSNTAPLFQKYPVGVPIGIEVRYLNIGLFTQRDVRVGYRIFNESGQVVKEDSAVLAGSWPALTFRDVIYPGFTPTAPGSFFLQACPRLAGDENIANDTLPKWPALGKPFDVRYEIEVGTNVNAARSPINGVNYAIGKPVKVSGTFTNSGVSDATNVPVRAQIRNAAGTIVYDRTATVLDIVGGNGSTEQRFPDFYPQTAGLYCVTMFSEYALEPVRSNDTMTWCFDVRPALIGTIRVGFGERFASIQEARDSVFYYGVAGPVVFELTNDSYTIATNELSTPALDLRGRIVGLGPNAPIVFRPSAGKTMVTIALRSLSGIGMWFGQRDTSNPSGYITFDGTTRKALTITYENTNTNTSQPAYQRSLPMFYGQGASNYAILNT